MRRYLGDPAVRRGVYDGVVVAAALAVLVVWTNVLFPGGPNESDSDPEYVRQILAVYAALALLLAAIGAHGRPGAASAVDGVKAGAAAGLVVAALTMATFLVVDNVFFDVVSQQHDKVVSFAGSGWSSMRAWVNYQLLGGSLFVLPAGTAFGAVLGYLGGQLRAGRRGNGCAANSGG
ncbi:MAG TPA: hypothetical protein VF486_14020 [Actinomycetes bacterium]